MPPTAKRRTQSTLRRTSLARTNRGVANSLGGCVDHQSACFTSMPAAALIPRCSSNTLSAAGAILAP